MANSARVEIRLEARGDKTVTSAMGRISRSLKQTRIDVFSLKNALAGMAAALAVRDLLEAGLAWEKMESKVRAAVGTQAAAAREMDFIRSEAKRLGLQLQQAGDDFGTLAAAAKGTSLAGQGTRDIFTAVAEASTVMKLSADETSGSILAIAQMMSKGKVSAEELRGQLGERLPGAFQAAARAMGVSTAKLDDMLAKGEIMAEDFLPRFAAELRSTFADQVPAAVQSAQSKINRFQNAMFQMKARFARGGAMEGLTTSMEWIANTALPHLEAGFWIAVGSILKAWEYTSHAIMYWTIKLINNAKTIWTDLKFVVLLVWETIKGAVVKSVAFILDRLSDLISGAGRMLAKLPLDAAQSAARAAESSAEGLRQQAEGLRGLVVSYQELKDKRLAAFAEIDNNEQQQLTDINDRLRAGIAGLDEIITRNVGLALGEGAPVLPPAVQGSQTGGVGEDQAKQQQRAQELQQLQQQIDSLSLSLADEEERAFQAAVRRSEMVIQARDNELISEQRQRELLLGIENQYQQTLARNRKKGLTDLQKFSAMSFKDQTSTALGEMVRMTQGVAQTNKTMFTINKAARMATASMDLISGTIKTWNAYPYPWNIPLTALHVATGAMQLSQLASSSYGGGAQSPTIGYGAGTPTSPTVTLPQPEAAKAEKEEPSSSIQVQIYGPVYGAESDQLARDIARYMPAALEEAKAYGAH